MAYTIRKSDGSVLTTIADSTRDTTTSLSLAGPNFVGYGEYLNENLVYLLENFAANSAPSSTNLQGQLWFDKFNQTLKVFTTQGYVPVSGVTNSGSRPSLGKNGDIWYNSTTEQMYLYDTNSSGAGFKLVGPVYTKSQGVSGAIPVSVEDASISGTFHNILKLQFGNLTYATVSADTAFLPTPPIPGFSFINPGITFSSNVIGPTINANVTGTVTGSVIGNLTGNVTATTLSGNLTGNVNGNLTGNVTATTLSGNLTGNVTATNTQSTNFSSGNVLVTGGSLVNLSNVTAASMTAGNLSITTIRVNNFSSGNILVTGGSATGLTSYSGTTGQATNFSTSNIVATGGTVTGLTSYSGTTGQATNFSTSNIVATGGTVTGLTSYSGTTGQATNFSSGNVLVTGGNVSGLTSLVSASGSITDLTSSNANITGGIVSNVTGNAVTFTSATLVNSVATTKATNDKTTAIATTAFVHALFPTGIIVMWNSSAASIPAGWQLCDGSNGTPDLRGQFVIGAGGSYNFAATGGAASVTLSSTQLPVHSHALSGSLTTSAAGSHTHSVSDPGHSHTFPAQLAGAPNNGQIMRADVLQATAYSGTNNATTGISLGAAADHTHNVTLSGTTGSAGGTSGTTQPHENLPPYFALCYIQKMY